MESSLKIGQVGRNLRRHMLMGVDKCIGDVVCSVLVDIRMNVCTVWTVGHTFTGRHAGIEIRRHGSVCVCRYV